MPATRGDVPREGRDGLGSHASFFCGTIAIVAIDSNGRPDSEAHGRVKEEREQGKNKATGRRD